MTFSSLYGGMESKSKSKDLFVGLGLRSGLGLGLGLGLGSGSTRILPCLFALPLALSLALP